MLAFRRSFAPLTLALLAVTFSARADQTITVPQIVDYLNAHRTDVALVNFTVGPGGWPLPTAPVLFHQALQPMPLGSTSKILLLAAYAREVEAGHLQTNQPVTLAEWERAYLPGTDAEAHPRALAELGIAFDELGFALQPGRRVPLSTLVDAMIRHSDNAAADYLLQLLGSGALRSLIRQAGLVGQQQPLSIAGQLLVAHNHIDGPLTAERLAALRNMSRGRFAELCRATAELYADSNWRAAELAWQLETPAPSFALRAAAAQALAPKGTAMDYALLLARVATGRFLSAAISSRMAAHLAMPVAADDPAFIAIGGKGGALDGALSYALVAVPKSGPFAHQARVSVVFLRQVPEALHSLLDAADADFVLAALLTLDPALVEEVRGALGAW